MGAWSATETLSYLTVQGLNAEVIESIIQSVDNKEEFVPAAAWSQVSDLVHMIDVKMHLPGLGVA